MNQKPVDDTPQIDDHEHVYICQDCGEIGTSIKPVDDKDSPYQILSNLFVLGLQAGAKTKTAKEVGYPIKEALVKLDTHYQKKYIGLLDDAIIYSAKHVGLWDEKMSDDVRKGKITKLYLDLPSLREALANYEDN